MLHQEAGSSPKLFGNSPFPRDCDAGGVRADRKRTDGRGMRLADFLADFKCSKAQLGEAELVALRLYSTAAFRALNMPLRDTTRTTTHPLAATVAFLTLGIKKLRATDTENRNLDLWRGMRNLSATEEFQKLGGTVRSHLMMLTMWRTRPHRALVRQWMPGCPEPPAQLTLHRHI